jgi:hypothetical protein
VSLKSVASGHDLATGFRTAQAFGSASSAVSPRRRSFAHRSIRCAQANAAVQLVGLCAPSPPAAPRRPLVRQQRSNPLLCRGEAVKRLPAIDRFLRFAFAAGAAFDSGMSRRRALLEVEIVTGIPEREIPALGCQDLRGLAEHAFEALGAAIDPARVDTVRRLLPGWH